MYRKPIRRRTFLGGAGAAGVGATALALVGCGDDDDTTPTAAATATTGPQPVAGSYSAIYSAMTSSTLDVHRELYPAAVLQLGLAYNNLVTFDEIDKGTIVPDIASKMPEQADPTTFVFTIRDG